MARVINQDGDGVTAHVVQAENDDRRVHRRSRGASPVLLEPRHATFAVAAQAVVTNVSYSIAHSDSCGNCLTRSLMNRLRNFRDGAGFPLVRRWRQGRN